MVYPPEKKTHPLTVPTAIQRKAITFLRPCDRQSRGSGFVFNAGDVAGVETSLEEVKKKAPAQI
jgi:hypothetical protein